MEREDLLTANGRKVKFNGSINFPDVSFSIGDHYPDDRIFTRMTGREIHSRQNAWTYKYAYNNKRVPISRLAPMIFFLFENVFISSRISIHPTFEQPWSQIAVSINISPTIALFNDKSYYPRQRVSQRVILQKFYRCSFFLLVFSNIRQQNSHIANYGNGAAIIRGNIPFDVIKTVEFIARLIR